MKVFVVLSCIALAVAKPQGYSYNQPSSSSFGGSHSAGIGSPSHGLSTPATAPAPSFDGSSSLSSSHSSFSSGSSFSNGASFGSSAPSFSASQSFSPSQSFSSGPSFSAPAQSSFSAPASSFGSGLSSSSLGSSFQSFAQLQPQAVVQKHIYVHVPPPQEEEFVQPHSVAPVQKQKHYKIIFIKAPSAPAVNPAQLQQLAQPQTEEKTLVYVLVKKPESFAEVAQHIQPAPVTPSKPEVYFIKYKAQKEQASFPVQSGSAEASLPISAPLSNAGISAPYPAAHKPSTAYGPPQ